MKQEDRREQTKRLLLDTTEELILEQGCSKTTLNDIMQRSGLSKGAIFHYVSGKDELFAQVLETKLEQKNENFMKAAGTKEFDGPMNTISSGFAQLENRNNAANLILMYLIGKSDRPEVAQIVGKFYTQAVATSKSWIVTGQNAGVIPAGLDPDQTAELFELITFGLRMRSFFGAADSAFGAKEYAGFISGILQPGHKKED
ncbi:TetR/AcrR family transcriptional regulator [Paenibacillus sepulcri]|uniref:TetR/AcrR family transcriptional regulator n=1 Tax=Paenibacillus sepulcri TaxID=359917 RepID=A0ABS7CGA4_9BACL|nr:TetR/AcrR family transcriptional regulator [Paenibacillus sepulcri]